MTGRHLPPEQAIRREQRIAEREMLYRLSRRARRLLRQATTRRGWRP